MGTVHPAYHLRIDQHVAVKEHILASLASARQFQHETEMQAHLHPYNLFRMRFIC